MLMSGGMRYNHLIVFVADTNHMTIPRTTPDCTGLRSPRSDEHGQTRDTLGIASYHRTFSPVPFQGPGEWWP